MGLGVRSMTGLVGDVAIPRRSGVASTYYLSTETTAITQSESTFDQVTMSPKNLAALSKYSRQTLIQATPGIESLVRTDLTDGILAALDSAIINGSGSSGQPTGIRNVSGIGSVAMGTNGGALTMEKVVDLETEILQDNALVGNAMAYVTNAKVVAGLKKLRAGGSSTTDGSFLFNSDLQAIGRGPTPLTLNGYPIATTNAIPSNLTKGTGSSLCLLWLLVTSARQWLASTATVLRSLWVKTAMTSPRLSAPSAASSHSMLLSGTLKVLRKHRRHHHRLITEEGPATAPFFLMKITCTRGVMASGKAKREAGQTYDVSDKDGALLITMGKAVEATAEAAGSMMTAMATHHYVVEAED